MSVSDHPDFDHHELVTFKDDPVSGLKAIIAVHNSTLGPALGGCRMFSYVSNVEALSDVLRLSRGMTYKSALAGIALGGGKSVIIGNPYKDKSRQLLLAMGDFVNSLNGTYITAEDSGTSVADMTIISEKTAYVSGVINGEKHGGDPSPITAYGVYQGIVASVAYQFKGDLKGVRIALQGIGKVGFHLARQLIEAGARVYASDINPANIQRAVNQLGVIEVPLDDILSSDVDVLVPCALGGAINAQSIDIIKAKVVAGAANNQLATADMGAALKQRGILYAPDYVINSGGIIDVYYQTQGMRDRQKVNAHVDKIGATLKTIFTRSAQTGNATSRIADELAEEILAGDIGDIKEMSA